MIAATILRFVRSNPSTPETLREWQPFFAKVDGVVLEQHFKGRSHLIGDPEWIAAFANAFGGEGVTGLVGVAVL